MKFIFHYLEASYLRKYFREVNSNGVTYNKKVTTLECWLKTQTFSLSSNADILRRNMHATSISLHV